MVVVCATEGAALATSFNDSVDARRRNCIRLKDGSFQYQSLARSPAPSRELAVYMPNFGWQRLWVAGRCRAIPLPRDREDVGRDDTNLAASSRRRPKS